MERIRSKILHLICVGMNPLTGGKNVRVRPVSMKFAHISVDVTVDQVVVLSHHFGSVSF